jgi:dTDP-4-dehydrorhamnose 3,5-epimerase
MIDGVLITPLRRIANPKGDVLHAIKRSAPGFRAFGEAYFSQVLPGDTKGWKRHRRMTLNLVVPVGAIQFGIVDDRAGSATRGQFFSVTLGDPQYARLTVPPGLWMAFRGVATTHSLLLNVADEEHDPAEADNAELNAFPFPEASPL